MWADKINKVSVQVECVREGGGEADEAGVNAHRPELLLFNPKH